MRLPQIILAGILGCVLAGTAGCTFARGTATRAARAADANAEALAEASRTLTTGALDSLGHAPSNAPVSLARRLLEHDQQIEGVPTRRLAVGPILAGDPKALADLDVLTHGVETLVSERAVLQTQLDQANARLQEMGRLYEAERNRSVFRRILGSLGLAGTVAAVVALFVLFPPALAIAGRLLGWLVSRLPALAGFVGVVSTKAFDGVVRGVEKAREATRSPVIDQTLSGTMDADAKRVVRLRKATIIP